MDGHGKMARAAGDRLRGRRARALTTVIAETLESRSLLSGTLDISAGTQTFATLPDTTVMMSGHSELHITAAISPISGSTFNLTSPDAWLFLAGVKPSVVNSTYLGQIRVNGTAAALNNNVRIVQYELGTVVIPQPPSYQPLQMFSGSNFTGDAKSFGQYVYYNNAGLLGKMFRNASSFKLKRGYMAVVATQPDGGGYSKTYIAQDNDLDVSFLTSDFDNAIQSVHVLPWRWVSKKGASDLSPTTLDASWFYNWNNNAASSLDSEYVVIRQQAYWPGFPINQPDVTELSGFNEPDNPVEDAYKTLNNGSVDAAIAAWPGLLSAGVRVGSPAVTDGGKSWLYSFMDKAIAAHLRVDYITIHDYRANQTAASTYSFLKDIWDRYHLPIWVTEFNNGANWTGSDPTLAGNASVIGSFIDMFDTTPWIERYAIYSSVGTTRQMTDSTGALTPAGQVYRNNASPIGYVQQAAPAPNSAGRSIAQLPLDGDTLDASGFGNNGQTVGVPAYAAGKRGQALVLDGADDYVRLSDHVASGSAFSFAAWVNWDGGANWQRIFDFGNDTNAYAFLTPTNGTGMRFGINNGGTEQAVQLSTPLVAGSWTHVALTLSGGVAKLYLNGTLAGTTSGITVKPSDFAPTQNYLGKSQFAADPLFKGRLDEVKIADYAFSASQIAAMVALNAAPVFSTMLVALGPAIAGTAFSGTIAGLASDPDTGDGITYGKAGGPSWLNVAADGTLSGTPSAGEGFPQDFVVTATDTVGNSSWSVVAISGLRGVAQLPFDGSAIDASGYGNNAQAVGNPPYVAGVRGSAIQLNGSSQYVQLASTLAHGDEFTFAGWVYWNGGASYQRLFDFGIDSTAYMFLSPSNGPSMRFAINNGSGEQIVETSALPANQWTHVAVTMAAGATKIYVNGVLATTSAAVTAKPSDIRPTNNYLGKSQYAVDPLFSGRLDDVLITDTALTAAQINALRLGTGAPTIQTPPTAVVDPSSSARANLSVLGADDGGESNLVYTWSVTSKPSGAPDPTFSVNASNAAKTTAATFGRAGTYTLAVSLRDADGMTTTSSVSFTVDSTLAGIASPSPAIASGTSVTISGVDQYGQPLALGTGWTWTASTGSITQAGVYTAPLAGSSVSTITATNGATTYTTTLATRPGRGWYRADIVNGTTLVDTSGQANTGTLTGTYSYVAGKLGTALSLAGGSANLRSGVVSGLTDFTIATWVYLDANPASARIFDFGTGTNAYMYLTNNSGNATKPLRFGITTTGSAGEQVIDGIALPLNSWVHVAVSLVGTVGTLFLNGVVVGTNTNVTVRPTDLGTTANNYLGRSQSGAEAALQGKLDEFRIIDSGLTAAGVKALRDQCQSPTIATQASASSITRVNGAATSNLSALGNSASGETGLTYTWSVVGTPAGSVAFSANGTNASKNAVATFAAAGTYQLKVTVANSLGASVSSTTSVTVNPTDIGGTVLSSNETWGVGSHAFQFTFDSDIGTQPWSSLVQIVSADGTHTITPTAFAYDAATRTLTISLPTGANLPDANYQGTLLAGTALSSAYSFSFVSLAGDANHDRTVNFADLVALARNYGMSGKLFSDGDFTGDGRVDFADLVLLAQNYNKNLAPPATAAILAPATVSKSRPKR